MNQSNKEYKSFLTLSGVHTFLNENPNIYFNINEKDQNELKVNPSIDLYNISSIKELIPIIANHKTNLQKTASNLVVFDGNEESKLMIIGEAPGKDEDIQGKPFVGRAGILLNKMLSAININREDVYITNVVPYRPPENRAPTNEEIIEFLPFLQRQIEIIKPSIIYLLGSTAAKAILSTPISIGKLRGKWHNYKSINCNNTINVLVSYHPAFLLRSPNFKKEAWVDLQILKSKLDEN